MTSTGLVLVALVTCSASIFGQLAPSIVVSTKPIADLKTPPISPSTSEVTAEGTPWPTSTARLGSLTFSSADYWGNNQEWQRHQMKMYNVREDYRHINCCQNFEGQWWTLSHLMKCWSDRTMSIWQSVTIMMKKWLDWHKIMSPFYRTCSYMGHLVTLNSLVTPKHSHD